MSRTVAKFAVLPFAFMLAACGAGDGTSPTTDGDAPADDPAATDPPDDGDGGAAAGGLLEQAQDDGIHIAFANEVPYGYEEGGEPTGQAPTVAIEVLDRLDITEVEATVVDFGALINGLNAGQYDMVAAGMSITADRAASASFSDPDYCAPLAFAVPEGNPQGLDDFEAVTETGATLGVLSGAIEDDYAVGAGVPDGQLERLSSTPDMVDALTSGRIDAFALTSITVREQTDTLDGYESSEGFFPVVDGEEEINCGGYVFRHADQDFRDAFNDVLLEMRANDEILPLIEEFGFTEEETELAKDYTVEDIVGAVEPEDNDT